MTRVEAITDKGIKLSTRIEVFVIRRKIVWSGQLISILLKMNVYHQNLQRISDAAWTHVGVMQIDAFIAGLCRRFRDSTVIISLSRQTWAR